MIEVSEGDWKLYETKRLTHSMLESALRSQSPEMHFFWISLLYKRYRLGDWGNCIPDPGALADKTYLGWDHEAYCLFHARHSRFGQNIIECAQPYLEKAFVFFDYGILEPAFDALNAGEELPYVPTYYAHPHDRYDYQTGEHMWD
ncbi:hypothetical protein ACFO5X_25935 [Seohaeicola nanhaiensis]|uniref:Uncharacterized protein n=1 Tax=Seohaeicola nanhaiensis TaxID=1387282 RepID=A0ABV9KPB4_9RHOB